MLKLIKLWALFLILIPLINTKRKKNFHTCGINAQKMTASPATQYLSFDKNSDIYRRRLNDNGFKDFHIYLDLVNFEEDLERYNLDIFKYEFIDSFNKVVKTIQTLLKVKPLNQNYIFDDATLSQYIPNWNKTFIGSNVNKGMLDLDIDLIIFIKFDPTMSNETSAKPNLKKYIEDTGQPLIGVIDINPYMTEMDWTNSEQYMASLILHEFIHILGFSNFTFENFMHNLIKKTDSDGIMRYYINSPKVLSVAKKYFNCEDIEAVELEEYEEEDVSANHWEMRILLGDIMSGYSYIEEEVISEFTLALLEDTGYYEANYYTGGLMRFGKGKGCEFLKNKCIDKTTHKINPKFGNEYFDSVKSEFVFDASCSSGRQSRTYSVIWTYDDTPIPSHYQYFENQILGGFFVTDYCPVALEDGYDSNDIKYASHCSFMGAGGLYGVKIKYKNANGNTFFNRSGNLYDITGEKYSEISFCYQSSLTKENFDYDYINTLRAVCYESFCSERSLTVKIKDDYIVCPRTGGKIKVDSYNGYFLCPDYNLICSGTVICNEMFDCVEKKSKAKESSYIYDYEIKTNQNLIQADIDEPDEENNYELSEDGMCPINCKFCKENKKCSKCRNDHSLVSIKNSEQIKCLPNTELIKGYYKNNEDGLYYQCVDNCETCTDGVTCTKCNDGYILYNSKCLKKIENCEIYGEDEMCSKCSENYAFIGNDRSSCFNKNIFDESYYTKDNGISYYLCSNDLPNCANCYYSENNPTCYLCDDAFLLQINEKICLSKTILDKTVYNINETHIDKCSNAIINCNECRDKNTCTKCDISYYIVNDEVDKCVNINNIELADNEYYLNEERTTYYSCDNSMYNNVQNCKKCTNKNSCIQCKESYTFINGVKSTCVEIETLENKYIQDYDDLTNFIKCENRFSNCEECDKDKCLACKSGFIFEDDDYSKCIPNSENNGDNDDGKFLISLLSLNLLLLFALL